MGNKTIWIINEYAGSPYHGMEFRHYYLAKELIQLGYHVTIISATHSHLFKHYPPNHQWFNFEVIDNIQYIWVKVPRYSSSHSIIRVLKWLWFSFSLFFLPIKRMNIPHYIIVSPMATFPVYPAYCIAKKMSAKWIFEVKDIWPLSIIELGKYSTQHPFIVLLKYFERFALKKSHAIVSVLPNYQEYLKDEKIERTAYYIPNGIHTEEINKAETLDITTESSIPKDKFIIGYTGTIGKANALKYLIEAARILKDNKEIAFVIVGNGDEKDHLMKQSQELSNVFFLNPISKRQIPNLLKFFDVCYIGLEPSHLFYYGVSPNKLFDYMLAAKPILMAISTKNSIVKQANCGISIQDITSETIANAILKLFSMQKDELEKLGQNGQSFVLKNHTFTVLAQKYHELLENLNSSKRN